MVIGFDSNKKLLFILHQNPDNDLFGLGAKCFSGCRVVFFRLLGRDREAGFGLRLV